MVVIALILAGCSRKGIIPSGKMARILHDMYLIDAEIENDGDYSAMADTTLVYAAVFDEYGYSVDDFQRSLDYYLHNPIKFKEVFKMAHDRFENEMKAFAPAEAEISEPVLDEPSDNKARRRRFRRELEQPSDMIEIE